MIKIHWAAKDKNDIVYVFEKKPCKDKENGCWWAKDGEEVHDLQRWAAPLQPVKIIYNYMRRIKNWEDSLTNLDPKDWRIK